MAQLTDPSSNSRSSSETSSSDERLSSEGSIPADTVGSCSFQSLISSELSDLQAQGDIRSIPPISLAYIGDAVFELYVRSRLLLPAKRARDYHQLVVAQVKAEQQAHYVNVLSPHLTDAEKDLVRRGRNATTGRHRRANGKDYQKATGFETLLGFLYLSNQSRLWQLLNFLEI